MTQLRRLAVLFAGLSLAWAQPAQADPVTYWNGVTVSAVTTGRPGPPGLLDIALVQSAVHDAVQAIEQRFEPYHYDPVRRRAGSRAAAVAAASHRVLVLLYPGQQAGLDSTYNLSWLTTPRATPASQSARRRPPLCTPTITARHCRSRHSLRYPSR